MESKKNSWSEGYLIHLPETASTNSYLSDLLMQDPDLPAWTVVMTDNQTAGRGQQGNSWFASPGLNLTFSVLLRPTMLPAQQQFDLSRLCALSVLHTLSDLLPSAGMLSIKWPNDIYYGDRKIAGILIEHSLTGSNLDYSILGVGLNINESDYPSYLPNPTSVRIILGHSVDLMEIFRSFMQEMRSLYRQIEEHSADQLHTRYMQCLYRRVGYHPFQDKEGRFDAIIADVLPSGELLLVRADGRKSSYAFKEIAYVLC
ncbi:biotin--acetyl-CoA-carboxylase ligase [Porphyromonas gingivalis SJD2]|uniref:biotin--[acetyl-CoA-carboxylase] ligase n=1 Tax=Porphyromonas gingivalis TaxID=837 RepID=UPI0003D1B159|nr:biotin--[acetyl-CoA-carboxylase] ligase [Porphyromonas gingivalis]ETA26739.1 biotin--acetyl-CoA-carboxylase ligase [Porphyromonas gingivalis SJD2]OWR79717.1 biotin--acetyl-CoA-carboxylase ligase [Porphyromonas gingivalis SJD5]